MRALLVLPIAMALGAWDDPCILALPAPPAAQTAAHPQLFNQQLNLAACVSRRAPRALQLRDREKAKAEVRAACTGFGTFGGVMTEAQASALTDQLFDQERAFLNKCFY